MTDFEGPPQQVVYVLDTSVLYWASKGNPRVLFHLNRAKERGVHFVVPEAAQAENRNAPDPATRARQLAVARDFGAEMQGKAPMSGDRITEYLLGPYEVPPALQRRFYDKHPEFRGKGASPEAIKVFLKENPRFAAIPRGSSTIGGNDVFIAADTYRYMTGEGKGKNVFLYACDRIVGSPKFEYGDPDVIKSIERDWKIKIAPESGNPGSMEGPPAPPNLPQGTPSEANPEAVHEAVPALRGKPVAKGVILSDGSLGRPPPPARRPSTPKGQLTFKGTLGPGIRMVGYTALTMLARMIVQVLLDKLLEKTFQKFTEQQFQQQCVPKITKDLRLVENTTKMLDILVRGATAHANLKLKYYNITEVEGFNQEPSATGHVTYVDYEGLASITDKPPPDEPPKPFFNEPYGKGLMGALLQHSGSRIVITTVPSFSPEEIELYRSYKETVQLLEAMVHQSHNNEDTSRDPLDKKATVFWQEQHFKISQQLDQALKEGTGPIV